MRWEVTVPGQGGRGDGRTVAVEADNWRAAIAAAIESLGEPAAWVRGWAADVRDGGTVVARCPRTRLIVTARNLDHVAPPPIVPVRPPYLVPGAASFSGASRPPAGVSGRPSAPPPAARPSVPPVLPQHHVFFARDENPDGGSALCYRERLIAVPVGVGRDGINALLMSYYEGLRSELEDRSEAKYVNVAVFDHAFSARAERPALAALSWKSWRSEVPEVIYPVDQLAASPAQQQAPQAAPPGTPAGAARPAPAQQHHAQPARPPSSPPPASQTGRRRIPTPADLSKLGFPTEEAMINEILAAVFEEMHGLLSCRTREAAAEFALDVAFRRIPCEAGSVLLSDINARDLVFSAVRGAASVRLKGRRLPMGKGIVGYAAKQGATIAVPDVAKDSRFAKDVDHSIGFITRSVIVSPLVHDGQTFGAIELLNRTGVPSFIQVEVGIVSYVASMLAEHLATSIPSGEIDFAAEEAIERARSAKSAVPAPDATKKHAPLTARTAPAGPGHSGRRAGK